jgi:glycine/D-amino acid oxidase-like deaminating enzyme
MNFFVGLISGIAASLGYAGLAKRLFSDPNRPSWISEYYVRSIWIELAGFYDKNAINSGNYRPSLDRLESDFFTIWPQLKGVRITHKWGGTLAMTLDFHPTIGVMGVHENIYYGAGYSGHGVSWSQLAGKIISQLYANEDTELTNFYCTNKIAPYLPPEPFRKVGYHLFKRFLL